MQFLGNLPLQRNQQDSEWIETQSGQESWPPLRFSIPGIKWRDRDIHLEWLERPPSKVAFQLVPDSEADTLIAELFAANEGEAKVVTRIVNGGTLEIGPGRLGAVQVIGVQVDRDTRALAKSGLEGQPALEGPSVWCDV